MKHLAAACLITLSVSVFAEDFYLTDASNRKLGPFEVKDGKVLTIDGKPYKLSVTDPRGAEIIEQMKNIILPEIDFRQANIHDVIEFLREQSVAFDKSPETRHGINMVVNISTGEEVPAAAGPADPFSAMEAMPAASRDIPLITFSARYISLYETMNIVCDVSDLKWAVRHGVVMITRKDAAPKEQDATVKEEVDASIPASAVPEPAPVKTLKKLYVVEEGDDIFVIAMMWGVSVSAIRAENRLSAADELKPGQKIVIPLTD